MSVPRVTIGLPVYNGERFVAEAIESVLAQTMTDWELIICDNASTDATPEIARRYAAQDPRVKYFRNGQNIGLARNFNLAFAKNRSPYFKWLAHDDVCLPEFLERCVAALDADPDASVAYPRFRAFDGAGEVVEQFDTWAAATRYDQRRPAQRFSTFLRSFQHDLDEGRSHPGVYIFGVMRADAIAGTRLMLGHMWADITLLSELVLEGKFIEVPEDLLRARVMIDNATSLMLAGDLEGWQRVLDPRHASKVGTRVSRYARYFQSFASVARADISLQDKAGLWVECAAATADRFGSRIHGAIRPRRSRSVPSGSPVHSDAG